MSRPVKKVTLADREEEGGEGGGEGRIKDKGDSRSALGEEVAAALEAAAKGLEACLEEWQGEDRGQEKLIRGTTEVVKATNKLVVSLKESRAAGGK